MSIVFEANIKNESNADGNIIAGPSVNLRWEDIANLPCSDCGAKIKMGEWSFIGYESPPSRYIRYCDDCKRKRESEGTLHDWLIPKPVVEFSGPTGFDEVSDYVQIPKQKPELFVGDCTQRMGFLTALSYTEVERDYKREKIIQEGENKMTFWICMECRLRGDYNWAMKHALSLHHHLHHFHIAIGKVYIDGDEITEAPCH